MSFEKNKGFDCPNNKKKFQFRKAFIDLVFWIKNHIYFFMNQNH